jgi:hypothetical protein
VPGILWQFKVKADKWNLSICKVKADMWNLSIFKMVATLASETSARLHGVKFQNAVA